MRCQWWFKTEGIPIGTSWLQIDGGSFRGIVQNNLGLRIDLIVWLRRKRIGTGSKRKEQSGDEFLDGGGRDMRIIGVRCVAGLWDMQVAVPHLLDACDVRFGA